MKKKLSTIVFQIDNSERKQLHVIFGVFKQAGKQQHFGSASWNSLALQ